MNDVDLEPFTEALRQALPNQADEARVRRRLVSAGVLAGVGVAAPGAATAASVGGTGVLAKVIALPLAVKVGASLVAVGLATVPLLAAATGSGRRADSAVAATAPAAPKVERSPARQSAPPAVPAEGSAPSDTRAATLAVPPTAAKPAGAVAIAPASHVAAPGELRAPPAPSPSPLPAAAATGSFPVLAVEPVDEGTLRAETALMERALSALRHGDLTTARRELATHAQRFPHGHLAPERERALARIADKETSR